MKRSHSRHSFPKDKMIPKEEMRLLRVRISIGKLKERTSSVARKVIKKMHTKKRRFLDKLELKRWP